MPVNLAKSGMGQDKGVAVIDPLGDFLGISGLGQSYLPFPYAYEINEESTRRSTAVGNIISAATVNAPCLFFSLIVTGR